VDAYIFQTRSLSLRIHNPTEAGIHSLCCCCLDLGSYGKLGLLNHTQICIAQTAEATPDDQIGAQSLVPTFAMHMTSVRLLAALRRGTLEWSLEPALPGAAGRKADGRVRCTPWAALCRASCPRSANIVSCPSRFQVRSSQKIPDVSEVIFIYLVVWDVHESVVSVQR
jgi:hypothetical protein